MEKVKIGFFRRIKKAIINFDDYEKFLAEQTGKSIVYLFKLIFLFAFIITIVLCYSLKTNLEKFINLLDEEFPDFEISDNNLKMEDEDKFEIYLEDFDMQIVLNNDVNTYNQNDYLNSIEFAKDGLTVKYMGENRKISYEGMDFSKTSILDFFESHTWIEILLNVGIALLPIFFIIYTIMIFIDVVTLSILGLIINLIIKTKFKYKEIFKMSVYSMTLPIILYLIYTISNLLFGVTIKYFDFAYDTISYIYLITVMLIAKSDMIKNTQELQKILEEEKKVKEELRKERQEEKEKKEEENKKEKDKEEKKPKEEKHKGEPQTEN